MLILFMGEGWNRQVFKVKRKTIIIMGKSTVLAHTEQQDIHIMFQKLLRTTTPQLFY